MPSSIETRTIGALADEILSLPDGEERLARIVAHLKEHTPPKETT